MGVFPEGSACFFGFEMDGQVAIDDEGMAFLHIRPGVPVLSGSREYRRRLTMKSSRAGPDTVYYM